MAGIQTDNIQLLDGGFLRTIEASDELVWTASLEVQNDVIIGGDLTVQGTTFTNEAEISKYADNHLYLNDGYETVAAQTGGLVVNYLPTSTNDTVATGGFTAGVDGVSDPTIATTGAATFAATDLVQVEGAADPANDGL